MKTMKKARTVKMGGEVWKYFLDGEGYPQLILYPPKINGHMIEINANHAWKDLLIEKNGYMKHWGEELGLAEVEIQEARVPSNSDIKKITGQINRHNLVDLNWPNWENY